MCNTEYSNGFLKASSLLCDSADSAFTGDFDIGIGASSWDLRSTEITKAENTSFRKSILFLFKEKDKVGLRTEHDARLLDYLNKISAHCKRIEGSSRSLRENLREALTAIHELYSELNRPLRLFVDLSSCPRYYTLSIIATCLKSGVASSVCVGYSETEYVDAGGNSELIFTEGPWEPAPIHSLFGTHEPDYKNHYCVSLGFEGSKTLRALSLVEPDLVSALLPNPGFSPEYTKKALAENSDVIDEFKIPQDKIVNANASDAVEVWKKLSDAEYLVAGQQNTKFLLCGPKPHSLGIMLYALSSQNMAVCYNLPESYPVLETMPTSTFWRYDIHDLSALD